jgi:hypothetical protein
MPEIYCSEVLRKMTSLNVLLKHIRSMIHIAHNQAGILPASYQHSILCCSLKCLGQEDRDYLVQVANLEEGPAKNETNSTKYIERKHRA